MIVTFPIPGFVLFVGFVAFRFAGNDEISAGKELLSKHSIYPIMMHTTPPLSYLQFNMAGHNLYRTVLRYENGNSLPAALKRLPFV